MTLLEYMDLPDFGHMPFDHFIMVRAIFWILTDYFLTPKHRPSSSPKNPLTRLSRHPGTVEPHIPCHQR